MLQAYFRVHLKFVFLMFLATIKTESLKALRLKVSFLVQLLSAFKNSYQT